VGALVRSRQLCSTQQQTRGYGPTKGPVQEATWQCVCCMDLSRLDQEQSKGRVLHGSRQAGPRAEQEAQAEVYPSMQTAWLC
jgi:hypothetical protein